MLIKKNSLSLFALHKDPGEGIDETRQLSAAAFHRPLFR
jgi:hypothetical protein